MKSPFQLSDASSYSVWRKAKLSNYPINIGDLLVTITDSAHPSIDEIDQIKRITLKHNMALYRFLDSKHRDKKAVHTLGRHIGLHKLDGNICADEDRLTSIEVRENTRQHSYIPYSNYKLSWHTDGYYNSKEQQIKGMLLHCAQPALSGGESLLMDTDIAYILLRDENPDYIEALMQPDAMTIPANILEGKIIRAEQTGPVFSTGENGKLYMRYSARKKNIIWKDNNNTRQAVAFLQNLWESDSKYIIRYTLNAGEGLVCNNVLHCRTKFEDSDLKEEKRLLYRGRYLNLVDKPTDTQQTEQSKIQGLA